MRRRAFAMLALSLASLTGCDVFTSPAEAMPDVSLALSAPTAAPDRPVTLTVTATNRTSRVIELAAFACEPGFQVVRPDDEIVGPPGVICAAVVLPPVRLTPGQSITRTTSWAGLGAAAGSPLAGALLPAGEYRLRGHFLVISDERARYARSAPVGVRLER